jgi:hypothetical protein
MRDLRWLVASLVLPVIVLAACSGGQEDNAALPPSGAPRPAAAAGATSLSTAERAGLVYMREEEKLAHDVYLLSSGRWGTQIFANITASESNHMAAMKTLLDRYSIPDPAAGRPPGSFEDATLQSLFDTLAGRSRTSLVEALVVGAEIEEIDLIDIEKRKAEADNADIVSTYANLIEGSKNHLRAFVRALASQSVVYEPRHLSAEYYREVIAR